MKKIFIILFVAIGFCANAQVQYGGQLRALNNSNTLGTIGRTNDGLKVADSAVLAKLSASVAVTQSGTWTVQPGNTANTTAWLVTGTGGTFPVTGTVTINAIPAGTNNIGDVDVLTVPADPFGVNADAASATGSISAKLRFIAATGIPVTSLPSVTIGTFPDNEPFNVAQINGVTPLMGAGNGGTGSLRVNIASDQVAIPVTLTSTTITGTVAVTKSGTWDITNAGTFATQPASATAPVNTMNSATANSGVNSAIAGLFDDVAPTSITENSFGFIRMSANHNIYNTIRDAAGNERGANVNASNQLSVSVDNTVTVGSHAVTNAGTFAVQVDGSALTALQLIDNLPNTLGSTTAGQSGALALGAVTTAAPSYTTAQTNALSLTTAGGLRVDLATIAGTAPTTVGKIDVKGADGDVFVRQTTASNLNMTEASAASILAKLTAGTASMIHLEDVASNDADGGNGMLAVRKATPANTSGTDGDFEFLQMSAGRLWTSATIDAALPAGTNAIGKLAANTGVTIGAVEIAAAQTIAVTQATSSSLKAQVDPLTASSWGVYVEDAGETAAGNLMMLGAVRRDAIASSSGTTGDNSTINTTAEGGVWATLTPSAQGGLSVKHLVSAATTNITQVKASAGQVYGYYIFNANAAARKVIFYNVSSSPTVGTTAEAFSVVIPASSGANVEFSNGIAFGTGIYIATVTGTADSDATAVAAGDLMINVFYK